MVAGPTEIEKDVLEAGSIPCEYMRTSDYTKRLQKIFVQLQYLFQTKEPVVMYAASGSGMLEAAVTNCLSCGDKAIYVNGGTFGKRWGDILRKHGIEAIEIRVEFGQSVSTDVVRQTLIAHSDAKAVFVTQDETSSGALTDLESIGKIVSEYENTVLVADCVSSLGVEKMLFDEWQIDIAVTSSQKALALPPGLGFLAISKKGMARAEQADLKTFYFDAIEYVKQWQRGQTPYTPAVSLINQLELRLEKIAKEGLDNLQKRYKENTHKIREGMKELGFNVHAKNPASCVSGYMCDKYDTSEIVRIMREEHHIEIAPSGGELAHRFFRVGNFGAIGYAEIEMFFTAFQSTLKSLDGGSK